MNGYMIDREKFIISARAELAHPEHQWRLARAAAECRTIHCLCDVTKGLRLVPFEDPDDRGNNLRRWSIEDRHLATCFTRDLGCFFAAVRETRYTSSIFLSPQSADASEFRVGAGDGTSRATANYGDFTHLTQRLLTRATLRAIYEANRTVNPGRPSFIAPTLSAVLGHLAGLFGEEQLADGLSPAAGAQQCGVQIVFGVTDQPLAGAILKLNNNSQAVVFRSHRHWHPNGEVATPLEIRITGKIGQAAGGKVHAINHLIAPPYFYAATIDRNGMAARVVRMPVASMDRGPDTVESTIERHLVNKCRDADALLVKLPVHVDLRELGPVLGAKFSHLPDGRLPARPDLIIFYQTGVWLIELAGIDNPDYLTRLRARLTKLRAAFIRPFDVFVGYITADESDRLTFVEILKLVKGRHEYALCPLPDFRPSERALPGSERKN